MKKDEFKVGDTVYCLVYGKGKIIGKIHNPDNVYPLTIEFENGIKHSYTQAGKSTVTSNRTLFFEEIPIPESAYKRPRLRAEKGYDYYLINGYGEVQCYAEEETLRDDKFFNAKNYFKTEVEAKESKFYKVFHEEE